MGIRDLEDICALAEAVGLTLAENYAMPANNRLLVFSQDPSNVRGLLSPDQDMH